MTVIDYVSLFQFANFARILEVCKQLFSRFSEWQSSIREIIG